jgi:hypothetical protein
MYDVVDVEEEQSLGGLLEGKYFGVDGQGLIFAEEGV